MKPPSSILRSRQINGYICQTCTRQLARRPQRRSYASTSSSTSNPEIFDLVCVGGGPAGLSLLSALRANPVTSSLKIALVESQSLSPLRTYTPSPETYSNRCSSLTPSSVRFLKDIGAWKHIHRERVQGYSEMRVWDGVSGAAIHFDSAFGNRGIGGEGEEGVVAYMNENLNLTSALLRRIDELSGVSIFDSQKVTDISLGSSSSPLGDLSQWPIVKLSNGRELAARLLVGADGGNSPVRQFAGIDSRGWDYGRVGVVATLCMESLTDTENSVAYQRFLPTGPVAMLPLPGNFSTLVWSTAPELANRLKGLGKRDFVGMVNAAFRLGVTDLRYLHTLESGQEDEVSWREQHSHFDASKIPRKVIGIQEGSVASFPLKMRHADTYIGERIALVGDAAHTVHPLAGQGLNQGQGDVESLAKTIEYSVGHGMDIGVRMSLESYEADRYVKNHLLMGVVDKLHKLYAVESEPVVGLRSLGLRAVDALEPVKGFFMRQAAGTGRNL